MDAVDASYRLYKHGLAYRKDAPVNWCPSCNTVLANEQVHGGRHLRALRHARARDRNLTQWFFKITDYAEESARTDLDKIDWPEKTKQMQRNWIGKSTGGEVIFKIADSDGTKFAVFTTRADTLYGVTYVVLCARARRWWTPSPRPRSAQAVEEYKRICRAGASEIDRLSSTREKTGVFTGAYCDQPRQRPKGPDLTSPITSSPAYGTGAVMAVPAHDERDFEFATKYDLPIERVVGERRRRGRRAALHAAMTA